MEFSGRTEWEGLISKYWWWASARLQQIKSIHPNRCRSNEWMKSAELAIVLRRASVFITRVCVCLCKCVVYQHKTRKSIDIIGRMYVHVLVYIKLRFVLNLNESAQNGNTHQVFWYSSASILNSIKCKLLLHTNRHIAHQHIRQHTYYTFFPTSTSDVLYIKCLSFSFTCWYGHVLWCIDAISSFPTEFLIEPLPLHPFAATHHHFEVQATHKKIPFYFILNLLFIT